MTPDNTNGLSFNRSTPHRSSDSTCEYWLFCARKVGAWAMSEVRPTVARWQLTPPTEMADFCQAAVFPLIPKCDIWSTSLDAERRANSRDCGRRSITGWELLFPLGELR